MANILNCAQNACMRAYRVEIYGCVVKVFIKNYSC